MECAPLAHCVLSFGARPPCPAVRAGRGACGCAAAWHGLALQLPQGPLPLPYRWQVGGCRVRRPAHLSLQCVCVECCDCFTVFDSVCVPASPARPSPIDGQSNRMYPAPAAPLLPIILHAPSPLPIILHAHRSRRSHHSPRQHAILPPKSSPSNTMHLPQLASGLQAPPTITNPTPPSPPMRCLGIGLHQQSPHPHAPAPLHPHPHPHPHAPAPPHPHPGGRWASSSPCRSRPRPAAQTP